MKKNISISSVVMFYSTLLLLGLKHQCVRRRKLNLEILQVLNDEYLLSRDSTLYSYKTSSLSAHNSQRVPPLFGRKQGHNNGLRGFHDLVDTQSLSSPSTTGLQGHLAFMTLPFLSHFHVHANIVFAFLFSGVFHLQTST